MKVEVPKLVVVPIADAMKVKIMSIKISIKFLCDDSETKIFQPKFNPIDIMHKTY